jgi:predicted RNA-binding protein with TRAM domain
MAGKARTASIAELARDGDGWSPLRMHLDVRAFGVNAWTASEPGAQLVGEHDEVTSGHEELYLITTGSATFTVDGEEITAAAGTVVFVPDATTKRAAVADEAGTTVFAVGAQPDAVFRPRAWDQNASVFPLFGEGDYNGAKRALTEALDQYEDREGLLYNIACAEARLGETEAAIGHLGESIALRPSFAELARNDEDLDAIRDDPRFGEIVGAEQTAG